MEKNKQTSPLGGVFFIMQSILVLATASILELSLLEEWIISIPRGTFQGTMIVIIGSIIVFAISWVVSCGLSAIWLKWENKNLPDKTGRLRRTAGQLNSLGSIMIPILFLLLFYGYFVPFARGTPEGGKTVAIGVLIIIATATLFDLSVMWLSKYFKTKKTRQTRNEFQK
jgi:ABC-type transport system involved in multi-copper enzyme maturation permease subunit